MINRFFKILYKDIFIKEDVIFLKPGLLLECDDNMPEITAAIENNSRIKLNIDSNISNNTTCVLNISLYDILFSQGKNYRELWLKDRTELHINISKKISKEVIVNSPPTVAIKHKSNNIFDVFGKDRENDTMQYKFFISFDNFTWYPDDNGKWINLSSDHSWSPQNRWLERVKNNVFHIKVYVRDQLNNPDENDWIGSNASCSGFLIEGDSSSIAAAKDTAKDTAKDAAKDTAKNAAKQEITQKERNAFITIQEVSTDSSIGGKL
jgi:hypothetical protein